MGTELKGGVLFRKREHPLWNPQRKARAAVSGLKECNTSGVEVPAQVCCYTTWVTSIFAAALKSYRKSQQSPPTTNFYKLATACRHAGTFIAQRVQPFKLYACNVGGRGGLPSSFSGGYHGGIRFEKRIDRQQRPALHYHPAQRAENPPPFGETKRRLF